MSSRHHCYRLALLFALLLIAVPVGTQAGDLPAPPIDGVGHSHNAPLMNATDTPLLRRLPSDYGDDVSSLAGEDRPSPRAVSNAVVAQSASIYNPYSASDWLWQWGQFLDHDIDLTEGAHPAEPANIPVPLGDPFFDPFSTGTQVIELSRSAYDHSSGSGTANPREQVNQITGWIDGIERLRLRSRSAPNGAARERRHGPA